MTPRQPGQARSAAQPTQITRRFAIEMLLWYSLPAVFLLVYIRSSAATVQAVAPHFLVFTALLGALLLTRLTVSALCPNAALSRLLSSILVSAVLGSILLYYTLVLVGLHSWGGVIAWRVIPTCFAQAPHIADALGIPPIVTASLLPLAYAGLLAACWLYLKHFDWTRAAGGRASGWTGGIVIVCGFAILAVETYQFCMTPWTEVSEPVSLTLFPQADAQDLEGHHMDRLTAKNIDVQEDDARKAYVPGAPGNRKNVVLIVVDALRPDHMGVYGYGRDTTPNLSRLAKTGAVRVVTGMHSSCGDTICGLLSLVSSKYPRRFSFHPFTLQQALRRNGYRIHLVLSGDHTNFYSLKSFYGAVDTFDDGTTAEKQGYFINDDQFLVDHVAAMPDWDGVPAMFQFHVMSTHILRMSETVPGPFQPAKRYLFRSGHDTGPGTIRDESATNFYDNGIVKTDAIIEELLTTLQRKGYLWNALVVITADHGESLGEHGLFSHTNSVREELLRIPLVLISYGYEPERPVDVRAFTSQVDIAPTILEECGLPAPGSWSGRALQEPASPDFTFFEQKVYVGLIDHRNPGSVLKFWLDTSSGVEHAFNLTNDPAENTDVVASAPADRRQEWRLHALTGVASR
jgi:glucan phosphoethanolaminetransferase (alkaline phosphatase superfamily)